MHPPPPVRFLTTECGPLALRAEDFEPHNRITDEVPPMTGSGKALGVLLGGVVTASAFGPPPTLPGSPSSPTPAMPVTMPMAATNTAGAVRVNLTEVVQADYREAVLKVVRQPTIATRATASDVICTVA